MTGRFRRTVPLQRHLSRKVTLRRAPALDPASLRWRDEPAVCVVLAVGIAERWTWRRTVPLAVALSLCGVLHLLAPNRRAVQITRDLKGFWTRHYPDLRRELGRRYPKHAWPEDTATPVPMRRR